jgi:hypothetical protein
LGLPRLILSALGAVLGGGYLANLIGSRYSPLGSLGATMILLIMALRHWFCFFVLGEINAQIECRRAARAPRSGSLTELPSDCRANRILLSLPLCASLPGSFPFPLPCRNLLCLWI